MSDQILLLDVPKDSPSHEERLQAFKTRVGIWTHDSGVKSDEAPRWSALLLPKNSAGIEYHHYGDSDEPMEIIASSCRILDEASYLVTGHTEREAIQNLCESNKIPFQP